MNSHPFKVLGLCFSLLIGLPLLRAQQTSGGRTQQDGRDQKSNVPQTVVSGQTPSVLREYTSLVNLTVTVTDKHNRLVSGLERQHFEIFEDNVKQTIEFFSNQDTPVSIGIIFDISGSMMDKINRAREALDAFIRSCHHNDDFFLVTFNQRPYLTAEFSDGETVMRKLSSVRATGGTALYDAVWMALGEVPRGHHAKRALLIISDGQDNSSHRSNGDLIRMLQETNVQVYAIGIADPFYLLFEDVLDSPGRNILDDIVKLTGGRAFFPRKQRDLESIVTRIALELRRQYSIGYMPTNQERNGKWRKIKVRVVPPSGLPSLSVRSREGYYAAP